MTFLLCLIGVSLIGGALELATRRYRRIIREARRINRKNPPWQIGFAARKTNEDIQ